MKKILFAALLLASSAFAADFNPVGEYKYTEYGKELPQKCEFYAGGTCLYQKETWNWKADGDKYELRHKNAHGKDIVETFKREGNSLRLTHINGGKVDNADNVVLVKKEGDDHK